MATQKVRPDVDAPERQLGHQQGRSRNRRVSAFEVAAVIGIVAVVVAVVVVIRSAAEGAGAQLGGEPNAGGTVPTAEPVHTLWTSGSVEPGRYVFSTADPRLDGSYQITIDVPDGYEAFSGVAVLKSGFDQTSVSTLAVSRVFADACRWDATSLDPSMISSADGVAAALANQEGLRVSTPKAVTVDGFAGTYMERRVLARDMSRCDLDQFRVYEAESFERWLDSGQIQHLWIVDVDGVPLVVDASVLRETEAALPRRHPSPDVRAELMRMVESIQIDPR